MNNQPGHQVLTSKSSILSSLFLFVGLICLSETTLAQCYGSCPTPSTPSAPTISPSPSIDGSFQLSVSNPLGYYGYVLWSTGQTTSNGQPIAVLGISGKQPGTYSYRAKICYIQDDTCSAWSSYSTVQVLSPPAMPSFQSFLSNACDQTFTVRWQPGSGYPSGASKRYDVQQQINGVSWDTDWITNTTSTSNLRSNIPENSTYQYKVQAYFYKDGKYSYRSDWRTSSVFTMPECAPGAVGSLTATQLNPESSNTSVNVTWSPASVAVGTILSYQVQRRVSGGSWPSENGPYDCEASGITSCLYPSVSRGTTYEYRVRAHKSTVDGPWSSVTGTVVYATPSTPNRPEISVTLQNDEATQYTVSWNAVENDDTGTISYRLWESSTGIWLNMNGATSKTYSSWATATTYQYKVKACNPNNACSDESETNSINMPGQPGVITIDDIGNNGRNYTLNWAPAIGTVDSYQLKRSGDGGANWTTIGNQDGELLSEAISNAAQGVSYQYKVRACNSTACGQYNNVRSYWVPSTPSGITFDVSAAVPSLTVNWTSLPATGYEIQQSTNGGTNWDAAVTVTSNSYTPALVSNGVDYSYRVRACNADGACSAYGNVAAVRVPNQAPGIPASPDVRLNIKGCSVDQVDDADGDGIWNAFDFCPGTPTSESVNSSGCAATQQPLDDDADGVTNLQDNCPATPAGESVDVNGCPITGGGSSSSSSNPISGLLAYWPFEDSGSVATESVAGYDGSYVNGAVSVAGGASASSHAAQFDGIDDYIEVAHDASFESADGALQLWFQTTNAWTSQGIFTKDSSGYDGGGHIGLLLEHDQLRFRMQDTANDYEIYSAADSVSSNAWHHVVVNWGSGGMQLYLDGQLAAENSGYTGGLQGNLEPIVIGANQWASGNQVADNLVWFFSGLIDEVALFNRALTPEEISTLASGSGLAVDTTTVVDFDDPEPTGSYNLDGLFEGIDFGTGQWLWEGPYSVNSTNNIYFSSSTGTSRSFSFDGEPQVLQSMEVFAMTEGTLTLSDDQGQTHMQLITVGSMQTVTTGWTEAANLITVEFTAGWAIGFDDITYAGANSLGVGDPLSPISIDADNDGVDDTQDHCPGTPAGEVAHSGANGLGITWTASTGQIDYYLLEQSADDGANWTTIESHELLSYDVESLTEGLTYSYQVSACNADGCSTPSTLTSIYLPYAPPLAPVLTSNGGLSGNGLYSIGWMGEYTINWSSAGGSVDTITVMETEPGGSAQLVTPDAGNPNQASYSKPQNTSGTMRAYRYAAQACNADNCSAWKEIIVQVSAHLLPGTPTGFVISAGPGVDGSYTLRWMRPAGNAGVTYYELDNVSTSEEPDYPSIYHDDSAPYFERAFSNGQNGETYTYRVRACYIDGNGCSAYTVPLSIYIPYEGPSQPGAISHSGLDSSAGAYTLNWIASDGEVTRYELQESTDGGVTWPLTESMANTGKTFTGQANGWTYTYRVRACNTDACGTYNNPYSVYIPHLNPGLPTDLVIDELDAVEQRLTLTWTAPAGHVDTYQIQHSTNAGASWDAGIDIASARYTAIDLGNGVHHSYRVRACNADECSSYTALVTAYLPFAAPGVPGALNHQEAENNPTSGAFTVHWTAPAAIDSTGAPLTHYQLEYSANGGGIWQAAPTGGAIAGQINVSNPIAGAPINATLSGLITGAAYSVRARSCNADTCGSYTAAYQVYLQRPAPGAPGIVTTTPSSEDYLARRFTVQWTAPASGGVNHYQLEVYGGLTQGLENWPTVAGKTQATSYTFTDRSYGETYRYRVRACGESESSAATCSVWVETDDIRLKYPTPNAPSGISVFDLDHANGSYTLEWNGVLGWAPEYRYELREDPPGSASWITIATKVEAPHAHDVSGKTPGTYQYQVRACNPATPENPDDCSDWSPNPAIAITLLPTPSAPASLSSDDLDGKSCQFNLDWTSPSGGVGTYHYELAVQVSGGSQTSLAWTTGTSHNMIIESADSGKAHTFKVRARTLSNGQYSPWGTWRSINDTTSCSYNRYGTHNHYVEAPKYSESGQFTVNMQWNRPYAPGLAYTYGGWSEDREWGWSGSESPPHMVTGTFTASNALSSNRYKFQLATCDHDEYMDEDPLSCYDDDDYDAAWETTEIPTTVLRDPGNISVIVSGLPDPIDGAYLISNSQFTLDWSVAPNPPGPAVHSYEVQYKPSVGNVEWMTLEEQVIPDSLLVTVLEFGVSYNYRVRSCARLDGYVHCGNWAQLQYPVKQSIGVPRFAVNTYPADGELVIYNNIVPVQWLPPWDMADVSDGVDHYEISIRSRQLNTEGDAYWVGPNVLTTAAPDYGNNSNPPVQHAMVEVEQGGQKEFLIRACGAPSSASCGAALTFQITVVIPPEAPEKPSGLSAQTDPDLLGGPFNGVLRGSFSVQPSGAATYQLPIVVPPGTAGVQPRISLNYSSQAGNGIAGSGWSLDAASVISRCNKTIIRDGIPHAVDYGNGDAYCLDGQKLVEIGTDTDNYRTERNDFRRITRQTGGDCGVYFEVQTQAGETLIYGDTDNSCLNPVNSTQTSAWALRQVTDSVGNYMTYDYDENKLISINYTGNTNEQTNTYASVQFEYEPRLDVFSGYQGGLKVQQTDRLKEIITAAGKYTLTYAVNEGGDATDPSSRLENVKYCAPNPQTGTQQCMSPIEFQWSESAAGWEPLPSSYLPPYPFINSQNQDLGARLVDIDNDGLTDLIYNDPVMAYRNTGNGWQAWPQFAHPSGVWFVSDEYEDFGVRFIDITGDGRPDLLTSIWAGGGTYKWYENTEGGWAGPHTNLPERFAFGWGETNVSKDSGLRVADLNGDGLNDLIVANSARNIAWINNGNGGWLQRPQYATDFDFVDADNISNGTQLVDINGDGLVDIFRVLPLEGIGSGNYVQYHQVYINTGNGWENSNNLGYQYNVHTTVIHGEFHEDVRGRLTDINGDGLPDYVCNDGTDNVYAVNTGRWFLRFDNEVEIPQFLNNIGKDSGVRFVDLNADGASDVVVNRTARLSAPKAEGSTGHWVYDHDFDLPIFIIDGMGNDQGTQLADLNGDGRMDIVWAKQDGAGFQARVYGSLYRPRVIEKVTDGLGNTTEIKFKALTDKQTNGRSMPIYERSNPNNLKTGQQEMNVPLTVVDRVTAPDGIGGVLETEYAYKGLTISSAGRGIQGFEEVKIKSANGQVATTRYRREYPYNGLAYESEIRYGETGPVLSKQTTLFCYVNMDIETVGYTTNPSETCVDLPDAYYPSLSLFIYPKKITSVTNKLDNQLQTVMATITEVTKNIYGAFGYLYQGDSTVTGDNHTYKTVVQTEYDPDPDWNWLGRIRRTTSTTTVDDELGENHTRTSELDYYPDTALLRTEMVEPGQGAPAELHTAYAYDGFGNKVITTVCASDFADCEAGAVNQNANNPGSEPFRTTTISYDGNGRYPVTISNSLGHTETHAYDHPLGLQTYLKGANDIVTTWEYDGFGRKSRETSQLTGSTLWNYYIAGNGGYVPFAKYAVETVPPTGAKTRVYYDALGQQRRALTQNMFGEYIAADMAYDRLGRVTRSSRPYFEYASVGSDVHWTINEYDGIGRTTSIKVPLGDIDGDNADDGFAETTSAYQGLSVIVTDSQGRKQLKEFDAKGRTVRVVNDLDGENIGITYSYDRQSKLTSTSTIVNNVAVTTITVNHDVRGNKRYMIDPDKGRWDYQYNGFGELIWQKDAEDQITEIDYDELGRMTERREFGLQNSVSRWTYDTASGAGKGKLHIEEGPSSSKTYSYDAQGRIINTEYNVGMYGLMEDFNVSQSYDSFSRTQHISYPQIGSKRLTIENVYSPYGGLWYVLDTGDDILSGGDDKVYWIAEMVDERGQVMQELLRNQNSINNSYNHATGWLQKVESWDADTDMIQQTRYEFDKVGNVLARNRFRPWIVNPDGTFYAGANEEVEERFTYDSLDRLTSSTVTRDGVQADSKSFAYDKLGNFTHKGSADNTYTYNTCGAGPHAVCQADGTSFTYDANGNMVSSTGANARNITYSAYNKPVQITESGATVNFYYGADRSRMFKVADPNPDGLREYTYYVGLGANGNALYEQKAFVDAEGNIARREHHNFIYAGGYHNGQAFAMHTVEEYEDNDPGQPNFIQYAGTEYYHRDHLGSVIAITDDFGTLNPGNNTPGAQLLSFDAWGKRRDPASWMDSTEVDQYTGTKTNLMYTGHESVPEVGLIHMNGRVYDPELGVFLSADSLVPDPGNSQSYNRYSYVYNNPIKYTDPSGHSADDFYKDVMQVTFQWQTHEWLETKPDSWTRNIQNVLTFLGMLGGGEGGVNVWGMVFSGVSQHFSYNTAFYNGTMSASDIRRDFLKGVALDILFIGTSDIFSSAIKGGLKSEWTGGKFADGAESAAIMYTIAAAVSWASSSGSGGESQSQGTDTSDLPDIEITYDPALDLDLSGERFLRFNSVQEMEAAMGPNAYVTGARPLEPLGGVIIEGKPGGILDKTNTEVLHENFFFTDENSVLDNRGFSPDGVVIDKNFPGNISEYRFTKIMRMDGPIDLMVLYPKGFSGNDYRFFTHNCQDYVQTVRRGLSRP